MNAVGPGFYDARDLLALAACFTIPAQPRSVTPLGRGLINATFSVTTDAGDYVLQRVNETVFPTPERIMENLRVLGVHLAHYPEPGLCIPTPVLHRNGASFARDHCGGFWRLMPRIPHGVNLPRIDTQNQARELGGALGRFHRLLAELNPADLAVTLPDFHVTPVYLARLDEVLGHWLADQSVIDRDLEYALNAVAQDRPCAGTLEESRRSGRIALRVTHGDPKLDNVLFHESNGRALGIIDLDTVQPGLIAHDIGDCLRSCCNRQGESGHAAPTFDIEVCRPVLTAYAGEMRGLLSAGEVATLFDGIRVLPYELGVRFLTDHLEGDRYFRVQAHGENLHKALAQFSLGRDIDRQEATIRGLIVEAFGAN